MKGKDMTKSEKKKTAYEKLKEKELEKMEVCVTSKVLFENCENCCECNKKIIFCGDGIIKYNCKCNKKARKDMVLQYDEFTNELKKVTINNYPYGIVNGKCESLVVMRMEDEFNNYR